MDCYIAKDVTERRKAEREKESILDQLQRANEKLEITLRSIADGVITIDRPGKHHSRQPGGGGDDRAGRWILSPAVASRRSSIFPTSQWNTITSISFRRSIEERDPESQRSQLANGVQLHHLEG